MVVMLDLDMMTQAGRGEVGPAATNNQRTGRRRNKTMWLIEKIGLLNLLSLGCVAVVLVFGVIGMVAVLIKYSRKP